jgi:Cys-rich protein (TIGR01571 family)
MTKGERTWSTEVETWNQRYPIPLLTMYPLWSPVPSTRQSQTKMLLFDITRKPLFLPCRKIDASELSFSLTTVVAKDETKLHWIRTSDGSYKYSCMIWTVIQVGVWILAIILLGVTNGFSIVFYGVVGVLALIALTQVRFYMRQKYSIPADCCADRGCLSDCLCTCCCSCCGVIQMMRHTHDERGYWYNCASQTRLNEDAPEIV